jgi:hypothetical protein
MTVYNTAHVPGPRSPTKGKIVLCLQIYPEWHVLYTNEGYKRNADRLRSQFGNPESGRRREASLYAPRGT